MRDAWPPPRGMMRVALVALVALSAGAASCRSLGRAVFREPVVTVQGVTVTGLSLSGGTIDVALAVANPNGYRLDAIGLTYRVDVDSVRVGEGSLTDRFVVPEKDSAVVHLPVRFTYAGIGAAGRALLTSGTIRYRVRGELKVATRLGTFARAFDRPGRYSTVPNR